MSKIARVFVNIQNSNYDASGARSAGAYANYLIRGEENTKKGSIRRESFSIAKGFTAQWYSRTPGKMIAGWKKHDQRWKNSRDSRGNKRKKTVKFGAVDHQAKTVFHNGLITLPNDLEVWKAKILAKRIMALFPDDCPFMAVMHFGKEYDEREEDNLHLHLMMSDRHDHGIGKKVEELFRSVFDKRSPKGRPVVQDMIEDVVRQFYIDFGYEVVENTEVEKIERRLERLIKELKDIDQEIEKKDISDEKKDKLRRFRERKIFSDIKVVEKEYVKKIVEEEKEKHIDEIENIASRFKEFYKFKYEFDNRRVDDSIDKDEEVYYKVDDDIITIDDGSDLELIKKDGREMILKKKNLIDSRRREEDDEIDKENYINEQKNIEIQNQASLGNEFFNSNIQQNTRFSRLINPKRQLAKRVDPNSQQVLRAKEAEKSFRKLKSSEDRTKDLRSAFEEAMNKADIKNKTTRSR